ncbi:MAG: MiaB/RimO family radical SAM methylthiotransferase [Candidatus Margulisbacteria bacterium]|jgi:threonylcarbamoyladenosine tRNA methylthiotransferase MtaB|nr:MiaB/RimO family radical SAM methylthiotransferase [Candidatus Margulisiibacteriota bacterium]
MRVYFHTFGCKSNQYETGQIAAKLLDMGFGRTARPETAELIVVNTCSVTHIAERKARNIIRKLAAASPQAGFYICGCAVNIQRESFTKIFAENLASRLTLVYQAQKLKPETWGLPKPRFDYAQRSLRSARGWPGAEPEGGGKTGQNYRVREFLKIQEGCACFCSYCIVPYARPVLASEPPEKIRAAAEKLLANNVSEIVLTGINLGRYQYRNKNLTDILKLLLPTGLARIRLSSLEPDRVTPDLLEIMAANPRLARHLHIPLQSGSDSILQAMNRQYSTADFRRLILSVRAMLGADCGLTTDIIVGFPGETAETFRATCALVQELGFSDLHIFPYSPRAGTAAAPRPATCPERELKQFCQTLENLRKKMQRAFLEKQRRRTLEVLVENDRGQGFSSEYARVKFLDRVERGKIYTARPRAIKEDFILAEIDTSGKA